MDSNALEKMLASGEDNPMLRYTLGMLSLKKGMYDAAATHFAAGLKMDPDHSASWKGYGKALMKLERLAQAKEVYAKGIAVAEARGDVQAAKEMKVFFNRLNKAVD
jgi:uncharacterized protein HemY